VLEPRPTAGQSQAHPRSRSHPVHKFMPERIDPQSPREDNPHPRKEITTTFTVIFLDIFTILSLLIHRSELSPSTSCLHSATEGPGRLSDGDHSLKRLIAVTRFLKALHPESSSALLPCSAPSKSKLPSATPASSTFPGALIYFHKQVLLPLRPLSPEQKSFRPDLS
jgi:hypothetical protein